MTRPASLLREAANRVGLHSDHLARRSLRQAHIVDEHTRYLLAAVSRASGVHRYTLNGRNIFLRHPTDSWTFEELLRARVYDLPVEIGSRMPHAPSIVDLGANIGLFGVAILDQLPSARIVGYEPDPANAFVLEMNLADELAAGTYRLRRAAAGVATGSALFLANHGGRSRVTDEPSPTSITVEVDDVMPALAGVDLAKIDIEGGEWPILSDRRLARGPTAIALEFHALGSPAVSPAAEARRLLVASGYALVPPSRPYSVEEFPDRQGMLWAVRRS